MVGVTSEQFPVRPGGTAAVATYREPEIRLGVRPGVVELCDEVNRQIDAAHQKIYDQDNAKEIGEAAPRDVSRKLRLLATEWLDLRSKSTNDSGFTENAASRFADLSAALPGALPRLLEELSESKNNIVVDYVRERIGEVECPPLSREWFALKVMKFSLSNDNKHAGSSWIEYAGRRFGDEERMHEAARMVAELVMRDCERFPLLEWLEQPSK